MGDQIHSDMHSQHTTDNVTPSVLRTDVILCEDDLTEEAKARFSYYPEILNAFQLNARNILANNRLSSVGRHLFCTRLEQNYAMCKRVLNYEAVRLERQVTSSSMAPPLVLCGLPRTGTTLLYNLLACDSTCRAPLLMDIVQPVPPIARSNTAAQIQRNSVVGASSAILSKLNLADYEQKFSASHPRHPHEEDALILFQAGVSFPHLLLAPHDNTELATWFFDDTNKDFAYEYHKTFLQMLSSVDAPRSHWLLKALVHTYFLDVLLRCYPSASIIITHRRLDEVLPSWARLCSVFTSVYLNSNKDDAANDRQADVKNEIYMLDVMIDRLVKFRSTHQQTRIFDVLYDDLFEQPIETVRRIYDYFGLSWSENFELAMLNWLRENPQGKQGRNTYTLEEFGLTHDTIEQRYEEYNSMFLKLRKPLDTTNDMTNVENSALKNIDIVAT